MQFPCIINRHKTMCPCTFIGILFFSKSAYKNDLASDKVTDIVKVLFFSTNISVLRPFLLLSLTPVPFSADIKTKHSRSQSFIPITCHGWNILQVYPTDLRNTSPKIRPSFHPVFRVYTQHVTFVTYSTILIQFPL